VSAEHLQQLLALYGPGLEAEVSLLQQLQRLSHSQREALDGQDAELIGRIVEERDRVMAALVTVESNLKATRHELAANREAVSGLAGFAEISQRHKTAADLVATIVNADQDTQQALRNAEVAHRFAVDTLNLAGATLAAYRRVVAPPVTGAGLVDRQG
jgi:hypothetical protein